MEAVPPPQVGQGISLVRGATTISPWAAVTGAISCLISPWLDDCSLASWSIVNLLASWICGLGLLSTASENQPPVEYSSSAFTATTGLEPYIGCGSFDDIAQPDLLVPDKSGQAYLMRPVFAPVRGIVAFTCLGHEFRLLAFA